MPSGWTWATLEELSLSVRNGVFVSRPSPTPPGVRILRISAVRPNRLDSEDVRYADPEPPRVDEFVLREGDLLFTRYSGNPSYVGACAAVGPIGERTLHPDKLIRVVVNRDLVDPRFVQYAVNGGYSRLAIESRLKTTAGQVGIAGGQLRTVPVPLAPRDEQARILSSLDEHLSHVEAAEAFVASAEVRLDALRRATTRGLLESRQWDWTTLGEIAEVKSGITKDSKRQSDPTFVEVPYLRVANVQRGRLDLSEVTTIRVHPDKAAALRLMPGDVLLNEGGDRDKLGRGWVWEGQIDGCIHQNHVFRARLSGDFDPYFVSTHANAWGQAWFEEHGRQTTNLASINLGTLRQLPVPAPPLEEQRAIVADMRRANEAHQRLLDSINHAKTRAAALRRSILAAAFSGQLVPRNPDDEPASVLLERIRAERQTTSAPKRRTRS